MRYAFELNSIYQTTGLHELTSNMQKCCRRRLKDFFAKNPENVVLNHNWYIWCYGICVFKPHSFSWFMRLISKIACKTPRWLRHLLLTSFFKLKRKLTCFFQSLVCAAYCYNNFEKWVTNCGSQTTICDLFCANFELWGALGCGRGASSKIFSHIYESTQLHTSYSLFWSGFSNLWTLSEKILCIYNQLVMRGIEWYIN